MAISAWPFQFFWNSVVVDAVQFTKPVSYWQSLGLLLAVYIAGRIFGVGFRSDND